MNIRELRAKEGLTQILFAEKYNIPPRTLQEWEQGRSNPPAYVISMLAKLSDGSKYSAANFVPGKRVKDLYLVTGGAGFIGSNLCEALLAMGKKVRCLDNLSTGKTANMAGFINNPNFEFIKGDVRDLQSCLNACNGAEYVLHQAAWGSVPRSIESPLFYCENNISGTLNMLEAARICKVKRFVYASSSAVYGDDKNLPKAEDVTGNLLSPYALTKRCDEEWAKQYSMHYGLATVGLRYFNVFGKRQDPEGAYAAVIPKFISTLLAGGQPVIYGDGKQSRDFTYVDNVVRANLKACSADLKACGKTYNIGCGEKQNLNSIYSSIAKVLGSNIKPRYEKERPGDIKHSHADISEAVKYLGYEPECNFEEGLKACIEWYRETKTT